MHVTLKTKNDKEPIQGLHIQSVCSEGLPFDPEGGPEMY